MKRFLTVTLLSLIFIVTFQTCEEAEESGVGPLYIIEVTPAAVNMKIDSTQQFTALGRDADMNVISDLSFTWTSRYPLIGAIDANGLITGVSAGTTTITASLREVESLPSTVTIEMILPSITTVEVTDITNNTATGGGTIIHNGGGELSAAGVCWSTTDPPTLNDNYATTEVATGTFSVELSGLYSGTTYFVRAYATNAEGTGYGEVSSFTTTAPPPVTDYDGNVYTTVQIGDQIWMAENLRVTHYRDGSAIPTGYSNTDWSNLGDTETGAYAVYDGNASNADTYGYLYNWYAVADSRNIAPEGWHVPTDAEWKELEMALGMSQSEADDISWRGTNEGSKLAGNADLWRHSGLENDSEFGASGFTALPSGFRVIDGSYYGMGGRAHFWSASEYYSYLAWSRKLDYIGSGVYRGNGNKGSSGFAIRCLRD